MNDTTEEEYEYEDREWLAIGWDYTTFFAALVWSGITIACTAIWGACVAIVLAIWGVIVLSMQNLWKGLLWLFDGVRPLRIVAFIAIMIVGGALIYVNALGAWERTHDEGYTAIIIGIELVVLVALPIIFAVRGIFTTPVAIAIFVSGIAIASFNAKPALENILTNGEGVVDPAEKLAQAEKLEQEVYGFLNPETGERMKETGLLHVVTTQEADASKNRTERGHTTASAAVDAEAAKRRDEINLKLQMAETYRAEASASTEASTLAIITFVVAELIRSFGLKVLVGFDPDKGSGKDKKRKKRRGIWNGTKHFFRRVWLGDEDEDHSIKFASQEEAEAYKAAAETELGRRRKQSATHAKKREQEEQDARLKIQDQEWALGLRDRVKGYFAENMTLFDMATTIGYTYPEFRNNILPRLFSEDELQEILTGDKGEPPAVAAE